MQGARCTLRHWWVCKTELLGIPQHGNQVELSRGGRELDQGGMGEITDRSWELLGFVCEPLCARMNQRGTHANPEGVWSRMADDKGIRG